jgi:cytochrome c553
MTRSWSITTFACVGMSSMKFIGQKITVAAVILCAVPAYADEPAQIKNCTWCHATSAQGLSTAPRLAGQRQQYIEKQLAGFHQHTRDNRFSRQFMWSAVAALSAQSTPELATYFSALPPKAANDGDPGLVATGKTIYELGIPDSNVLSRLPWAECRRRQRNSASRRPLLFVLEAAARPVGRGISRAWRVSDAACCARSVRGRGRRIGLLPQLHQMRPRGRVTNSVHRNLRHNADPLPMPPEQRRVLRSSSPVRASA